jgi:hypothetical protein
MMQQPSLNDYSVEADRIPPEKLSLPFYLRLLFALGQWMGHHHDRVAGSAIQWWHCRNCMVIPSSDHQLYLLHSVHGGDGEHGSYCVSKAPLPDALRQKLICGAKGEGSITGSASLRPRTNSDSYPT